MKRKWLAALCLLCAAAMLTACSGGGQPQSNQVFTEVTQYLGPTATVTETPVPVNTDLTGVSDGTPVDTGDGSIFSQNPYVAANADNQGFTPQDAMNEEAGQADDTVATDAPSDQTGALVYGQDTTADSTVYPYAGSSPIPLDPIDAPTPTPRPTLTFTYVDYSAAKLGLNFKGPAGWVSDESVDGVFTLTEPAEQVKDGQAGIVNVYASPVSSNYTQSNLENEIKQRLNTLSESGYKEWKPSYTATRFLLGSKGVYANFTGTLKDGTAVGGRIHAVCVDKVLYCIQITYPLGYKDDYLNVFSQVRQSLKRAGK
jgi:hypothetical protein